MRITREIGVIEIALTANEAIALRLSTPPTYSGVARCRGSCFLGHWSVARALSSTIAIMPVTKHDDRRLFYTPKSQ